VRSQSQAISAGPVRVDTATPPVQPAAVRVGRDRGAEPALATTRITKTTHSALTDETAQDGGEHET
jgi:hypothetical protein